MFYKVLHYHWKYKSVQVSSKVNGIFYFVRRIPLLGKHVPSSIYMNYELKKILHGIGVALSVLLSLGAKFVWVGSAILLSYLWLSRDGAEVDFFQPDILHLGLFFWFVVVVLFLAFYTGFISYGIEKKELDFVDNFQIERNFFFRMERFIYVIKNTLCYLPAFLLVGFLCKSVLLIPLSMALLYSSFSFFFYYLGRLFYQIHLTGIIRQVVGSLYGILVFVFLGMTVYKEQALSIVQWLIHPMGIFASILLLISSVYLLLTYKQENAYLLHLYQGSNKIYHKIEMNSKNEYLQQGLQMQDKLELTTDQDYTNLQGSNYLNALLFSRYRQQLYKSLLIRVGLIALSAVILIIAGFFLGSDYFKVSEMYGILPVFIFIMYIMSFGEKVVQMSFLNCDSSMLYFPFYRESKTILQGFRYRFRKTLFYNGIIAAALFVAILLFGVLHMRNLTFQFYGIFGLLMLSLVLLFSFHEWFIYYILQPYTSDMEVKNPIYKGIKYVVYMLCYFNINLRVNGWLYPVLFSVAALLYVSIGFWIIQKKAPKTFQLKS